MRTAIATILAAIVLAAPAGAAQQGALGATSKGEITITATVAASMRASGLSDTYTADSDSSSACMWSNTMTRGYSVSTDGATVVWQRGIERPLRIRPASAPVAMTADATDPRCRSGNRTDVSVDLASAAPTRATTLIIAPE